MRPRSFTILITALFLAACTPKVTTSVTEAPAQPSTPATPTPPADDLSDCPNFTDAPDFDAVTDDYVIYRQLLNAKQMKEAMPYWRRVYAVAPAADGQRSTVFTDGIAFYNDLLQRFPDRREAYGDTIIQLYQEARNCYPGDGYMAAIQGFDSYYTYPGTATDEEIYNLFKESIEIDGPKKLNYFIINPMSKLVVERHREELIDDAEAKMIADALRARLAKGLAECKGSECEAWNAIQNYAPETLRYFETVEGFYDCQYFVDQYYPDFEAEPEDCDVVRTVYSRLRYGGCAAGQPEYDAVLAAYNESCRPVVNTGPSSLKEAFDFLESGSYDQSIEKFIEAAEKADETEKKGRYFMYAAKVYYAHKRNFGQARALARRAADADPNTGEPYLLIGTLYASSGPLCGPGTGFDSQIVTWPAIDKWQQAKRIQPDLAGKANQLINRYTQYMPSKSDIFQRGIKEGDSFRVGCWIQETTRVRTP